MSKPFKYDEIKEHFEDFIHNEGEEWVLEHKEELHHEIFNTDYYIIGRYEAKQWLGDNIYEVIGRIVEYEQFNFGELTTDLSEPEKIVNMYTYIIGEDIVSDYLKYREEYEQTKC